MAAEDGGALADAYIVECDEGAYWVPARDDALLADENGMVDADPILRGDIGGRLFIALAPGRTSRSVDVELARQALERGEVPSIQLSRGRELAVSVRTESGLPISGAQVILQTEPFGVPHIVPDGAIGSGASRQSIWAAATDARGHVTIDALPERRYWISARHPHFGPSTDDYVLQRVDVATESRVTVLMSPLYGVAFYAMGAKDPVHIVWDIDYTQLRSLAFGVTTPGIDDLESKFPGCAAFVHRPIDAESDFSVRCRLIDGAGRQWESQAPLQAMADIQDAVYMEPLAGDLAQRIKVGVRTARGVVLDCRLTLRHEELGIQVLARTGDELLVPVGRYRVGTFRATRQLHEALHGMTLDVRYVGSEAQDMVMVVESDLVPVFVRPRFLGRPGLGVLLLDVDTADDRGCVIANWDASKDELSLVVPRGRLQVKAKSAAYEESEIVVEIGDDDRSRVVDLPLRERAR